MSDSGQLNVGARRPAQVQIRSFDPTSDLEICQKIYQIARSAAFYWIDPKRFRLRDFSADIKGESVAVAEEPNRGVVGFVGIWFPEHFIHHLYVLPELHRRGIGKALLDHALAQIGRPARLKCQQRNRNACEFYMHLGWRSGETGYDSIGDWIEFLFD
ncbi:MAG TPA: GNAT family N-acetyltransferase [Chthoniobacterales bacterium]|nr:GNAT family N-acetyltransferase [Chthoniobacterales bacterium]